MPPRLFALMIVAVLLCAGLTVLAFSVLPAPVGALVPVLALIAAVALRKFRS